MQIYTMTGKVFAGLVLSVFTLGLLSMYVFQTARPQAQTPVTAIMAGELHYPLSAEQQALQQQRIRIFTEVVETSTKQQEFGIVKPEQVFADQQTLLLAKLSLANQPSQQKAVLTELQQLYQQLAKRQQAEFDVGLVHIVELNRTKAQQLEIEMLLLQANAAASTTRSEGG